MEERFITRNQLNRFSALVTKRINRKMGHLVPKMNWTFINGRKSPGTLHNLHIILDQAIRLFLWIDNIKPYGFQKR